MIPWRPSASLPSMLWGEAVQVESITHAGSLDHILDFQWGKFTKKNPGGRIPPLRGLVHQRKERKRRGRLTLYFLLFVYKDPNSPPPLGVWFGGWDRNGMWGLRDRVASWNSSVIWWSTGIHGCDPNIHYTVLFHLGSNSSTDCQLPSVRGAPSFILAPGPIICKPSADISVKISRRSSLGARCNTEKYSKDTQKNDEFSNRFFMPNYIY